MTNTEIVGEILLMTKDFLQFMLPIIGIMAGIIFIVTWLMSITVGSGRRTFK